MPNPSLPNFYNLKSNSLQFSPLLKRFYGFVLQYDTESYSQLYQDLFALFILNQKKGGSFLEFGATNGIELSNTALLEKKFGWHGVLAEPSPQWHKQLKKNRPEANIITDCIYSETGQNLDFFVSKSGVLSTLEEFRQSDISSMPGNTASRNKSGHTVKVSTISLNDVFIKYFNSKPIDFMSVDTEGSELLILKNFNFKEFGPKCVTVEHNFTNDQEKIDQLFFSNNYIRLFKKYTQFDAWYVRKD